MRDPVETVSLPLPCQESPDRGRTHLEEEPSCLIIDMEMPMGDEVLHKEEHASCQTDRTQERAGCPDGDECLLAQRAVPGRTVPVDMLRGISHQLANGALLFREEVNAAHLSLSWRGEVWTSPNQHSR